MKTPRKRTTHTHESVLDSHLRHKTYLRHRFGRPFATRRGTIGRDAAEVAVTSLKSSSSIATRIGRPRALVPVLAAAATVTDTAAAPTQHTVAAAAAAEAEQADQQPDGGADRLPLLLAQRAVGGAERAGDAVRERRARRARAIANEL